MTAKPTTVYPLAGVFAPGVPHVTTEAPSKAAAAELEATGAFTTDPAHPNRQPDPEAPAAVNAPTPAGPTAATAADAPAPTTELPTEKQPADQPGDTPTETAATAETKES
jgi:hypothetical protein